MSGYPRVVRAGKGGLTRPGKAGQSCRDCEMRGGGNRYLGAPVEGAMAGVARRPGGVTCEDGAVWTWGKVIVVLLAGVLLGCGGAGSADEVPIWSSGAGTGPSTVATAERFANLAASDSIYDCSSSYWARAPEARTIGGQNSRSCATKAVNFAGV